METRQHLRRYAGVLGRGLSRLPAIAAVAARSALARFERLRTSALGRRLGALLRRALRIGALAGVLVALALAFEALCLVRIEPGEIGVRQREWGAQRGVEALDHPGPRLFVVWPGRERWHRLDGRTRTVTFAPENDGGGHAPLEVRTREGNAARVWASVPYRVRPGAAHRIVADGSKSTYLRQVGTTVEKVLTQEFARLSSDEFHDPAARRTICEEALVRLNGELGANHIEADGVWIRAVEFPPTYEKTRQEQQLRGQSLLTQEVLDRLAARQLENQFVAHAIARDHSALLTRLTRSYDDAHRAAKLELELQRARNEALGQELGGELARRGAELEESFAQTRHAEEHLALAELALGKRELEDELARDELELGAVLDAELESLRRAGESELARLGLDLRDMEQDLASELSVARTGRERELEEQRRSQAAVLADLRLGAERRARELRDGADLRHDALLAEADLALEAATVERERLRGEVLATQGGRLWLAREAARRLRFGRIVLDPRDGKVPSPMELDALGALLIGRH